jgi:hypothetical protein
MAAEARSFTVPEATIQSTALGTSAKECGTEATISRMCGRAAIAEPSTKSISTRAARDRTGAAAEASQRAATWLAIAAPMECPMTHVGTRAGAEAEAASPSVGLSVESTPAAAERAAKQSKASVSAVSKVLAGPSEDRPCPLAS